MFQSGGEFSDDLDRDTSIGSVFQEPENSALNSTTQNVRRLMASATEQSANNKLTFDSDDEDVDDEDLTAALDRVESQGLIQLAFVIRDLVLIHLDVR